MGFHFFTEVNTLRIQIKENTHEHLHANGDLEEFNAYNQFLKAKKRKHILCEKSLIF
ncbi:hypothetical protein [Tenacibaculum sp. C7A-26P2]|uniref:hypothetical protein n=1 Tax=Tenacibaculum sp. C7A-26P2 TaxID=3447504 RepID=UPI003F83F7B5